MGLYMTLEKVIRKLRENNEDVPQPMRLPTPKEVEAVEKKLKVSFHRDYRKFLLEASDVVFGTLEPCTVTEEDSHTYLVEVAQIAWDDMDLPRSLLPICEDNGDYFCMNESGKVVFWSHYGGSDEQWDSLADWISEVWLEEE